MIVLVNRFWRYLFAVTLDLWCLLVQCIAVGALGRVTFLESLFWMQMVEINVWRTVQPLRRGWQEIMGKSMVFYWWCRAVRGKRMKRCNVKPHGWDGELVAKTAMNGMYKIKEHCFRWTVPMIGLVQTCVKSYKPCFARPLRHTNRFLWSPGFFFHAISDTVMNFCDFHLTVVFPSAWY